MDPAPVADRTTRSVGCPVPPGVVADAGPPIGCPLPHVTRPDPAPSGGCPVLHGDPSARRTKADLVVRRLLRIPDRPAGASPATAYRAFRKSMLISATRCTLTYVVFPFLLPFLHILKGGAPVIGGVIGVVALVSDTFTIRRFFAIDHKWRWYFASIALAVMGLLSVLLVQDIGQIVAHVAA